MRLPFLFLAVATTVFGFYDPQNFWWLWRGKEASADDLLVLTNDVTRHMKEYMDDHQCNCCSSFHVASENGDETLSGCDEGSGSGFVEGVEHECTPSEPWIRQQFTEEYYRVLKLMVETAMSHRLISRGCCVVTPIVPECSGYYCQAQNDLPSKYEWPTVFYGCKEPAAPGSGCVEPLLASNILRFMKNITETTAAIRFDMGC